MQMRLREVQIGELGDKNNKTFKRKSEHQDVINSQRTIGKQKKMCHKPKHNNTKHKTKHEHQKPDSLLFHHLQSFNSHLEHFRSRVFCLHVVFCSENRLNDLHCSCVKIRPAAILLTTSQSDPVRSVLDPKCQAAWSSSFFRPCSQVRFYSSKIQPYFEGEPSFPVSAFFKLHYFLASSWSVIACWCLP